VQKLLRVVQDAARPERRLSRRLRRGARAADTEAARAGGTEAARVAAGRATRAIRRAAIATGAASNVRPDGDAAVATTPGAGETESACQQARW
jgi:hypothetical protein